MMEGGEMASNPNNTIVGGSIQSNNQQQHYRGSSRLEGGGLAYRGITERRSASEFVLQWGNRKRLRCMKIQVKDDTKKVQKMTINTAAAAAAAAAAKGQKTTMRVERRGTRTEKTSPPSIVADSSTITPYFNLRQRPASPSAPPRHRILRNSEGGGMRRGSQQHHHHHHMQQQQQQHHVNDGGNNNNNNHSGETGNNNERGEEGAWPPKFVIALTNKEKEEDFMAIKGSKLPQRPKKRAKVIQRTLSMVSPGAWLCDLTLDRYEVREKKTCKKRARGLKGMSNHDSDSE